MLTKEQQEISDKMNEINSLVKEFGLVLYGYDPDVACCDIDGNTYIFDKTMWRWLRPLLEELKLAREVLEERK